MPARDGPPRIFTPTWTPALIYTAVAFALVVPLWLGVDTTGLGREHWLGLLIALLVGWHVVLAWSPLQGHGFVKILVATVLAVAWGRLALADGINQQLANLVGPVLGALSMTHAAVWAVAARGAPRVERLAAGGLYLAAVAAVATLYLSGAVRIVGMTGDFLPIVAWGGEPADEGAAPLAAAPSGAPGAGDVGPLPGLAPSPQFFGPRRDGRLEAPALVRDWEQFPPRELWRVDVGAGWSGFAVEGRRAVTQEQHREGAGDGIVDVESVVCRDLGTGAPLWVHREQGERFDEFVSGAGPRATPTIDAGRVFAMGATGVLVALRLEDGEVLWRVDLRQRFGSETPEWGFAASPLVCRTAGPSARELVVVPAGAPPAEEGAERPARSLVALDAATGETVWAAGREPVHYSSPVLATFLEVPQVLIFGHSLRGHRLDDGTELWSAPWRTDHPHVAMPAPVGSDDVLASSGYGAGMQRLEIARDGDSWSARQVWRSAALKAKFSNFVVRGDVVYGYDDGKFVCVDVVTGRRRWRQPRPFFGHGQLLSVGDLLLATVEEGAVVLVDASPDEYREFGRLEVFDHKMWNPPTVAGRYLLVRTDREAACYLLEVE